MRFLLLLLANLLAAQQWQAIDTWRPTAFPKAGNATVEGEKLVLHPGAPMTGLTATSFTPRINYEIRFEATRRSGNDFFCSLTFPYLDSHATWVNGGWGGDIVGISSIDNWDASENETRTYFNFENNRFYRFRLEVTQTHIKAWVDDKLLVNLSINGRAISLRRGMDPTTPLSFFSYSTAAEIRKVEYRLLPSR